MSSKKLAFIIAFLYVGLGTIYSFIYWTNYALAFPEDSKILFHFFAPVSFFPITVLFTEKNPLFFILISQSIALLLMWSLAYGLVTFFKFAISNFKKR